MGDVNSPPTEPYAPPGIPSGAVLLNQPDEPAEKTTLVEHLQAAIEYVQDAGASAKEGAAKREYALCITHLEDAVMRFNRGKAIDLQGCTITVDLEKEDS